jgi:hypothetical protein
VCLRAFAAAGLEVIVLKGAALAEAVYGDVALRPMVDLDLLVQPHDRDAARALLARLGYAGVRREVRPGALAEQESEIELCKHRGIALQVDLHWSLFDSPYYARRVDAQWVWQTAVSTCVAGEPARVLGTQAALLHLCGHLALHHAGRGLLWWQDLVELLRAPGARVDWDDLLARARLYDLQLALRSVLTGLAEEWQAPIPAAVLSQLRDLQPSPYEAWLFPRLSQPHPAGARLWTDLASLPGWAERWRFATSNLFPSADYMRQRYDIRSAWLLPLFYPYRWLRGLLGA